MLDGESAIKALMGQKNFVKVPSDKEGRDFLKEVSAEKWRRFTDKTDGEGAPLSLSPTNQGTR